MFGEVRDILSANKKSVTGVTKSVTLFLTESLVWSGFDSAELICNGCNTFFKNFLLERREYNVFLIIPLKCH